MNRQANEVKPRRVKFDKFANPSPEEIPSLWRELCALADLAPESERGGFHRLRSRLLRNIPNCLLPQFLDSLAAEGGAA